MRYLSVESSIRSGPHYSRKGKEREKGKRRRDSGSVAGRSRLPVEQLLFGKPDAGLPRSHRTPDVYRRISNGILTSTALVDAAGE
jgi:hypothetical protein